jgi:hypothetical protein
MVRREDRGQRGPSTPQASDVPQRARVLILKLLAQDSSGKSNGGGHVGVFDGWQRNAMHARDELVEHGQILG